LIDLSRAGELRHVGVQRLTDEADDGAAFVLFGVAERGGRQGRQPARVVEGGAVPKSSRSQVANPAYAGVRAMKSMTTRASSSPLSS
jgi:hypothetical protein